jgi:hypothetical protein
MTKAYLQGFGNLAGKRKEESEFASVSLIINNRFG